MKNRRVRPSDRIVVSFALCVFAPAAIAHDMGNVLIAYALVLAIPIPAALALVGWLRALLVLVPLWALALWLANSGHYGFMYALLFLPYGAWLVRAVSRRARRERHEA